MSLKLLGPRLLREARYRQVDSDKQNDRYKDVVVLFVSDYLHEP